MNRDRVQVVVSPSGLGFAKGRRGSMTVRRQAPGHLAVCDAATDRVAAGISSPAPMSRLRTRASKQVSAPYGSVR